MLTVGSLFSGAGLCDLGLHWAGFQHKYFCEVDPFCQSVLRRHWPDVPMFADIRELSGHVLPHVDVLCGGFPCQDVSVAGKRKGITSTSRSGLWNEYKRIITEVRPRYIIAENVSGLLSLGIEDVLQGLAEVRYDAEWEVLPAASLGAPHHRERVFIIAYPHRYRSDSGGRLLAPLERIVADNEQYAGLFGWLGIRFDRADKASALAGYGRPIVHRVDDGGANRLDDALWAEPRRPHQLGRVDTETAKSWIPRLKALGNGITPQQSFAIAACILIAEGYPIPDVRKGFESETH